MRETFSQGKVFAERSVRGTAVPQAPDAGHGVSHLPESVLPHLAVDVQLHGRDGRRVPGVLVQIPAGRVQLVAGRQPLLLSEGRLPAARTVGHIAVLLQ